MKSTLVNIVSVFVLIMFISMNSIADEEIEHVVWDTEPVIFYLEVGKQRRLIFPGAVKIEMPAYLNNVAIDVITLGNGATYWKANKSFDEHILKITSLVTQKEYLIRVKTVRNIESNTIIKVLDKVKATPEKRIAGRKIHTNSKKTSEVDMLRYVSARVLNSVPRRLQPTIAGVSPVKIDSRPYYLYESGEFQTVPVMQFKSPPPRSFYVTAVKFINKMPYKVSFDPRYVTGEVRATSPLHEVTYPTGHKWDTSIVLYVTDRSFQESLASGVFNRGE